MHNKKGLFAVVAIALIASRALAADMPGAADPNSGMSKSAPATQPGLPDPSSTARMSDVGDGTTPSTRPAPSHTDPSPPAQKPAKSR